MELKRTIPKFIRTGITKLLKPTRIWIYFLCSLIAQFKLSQIGY